MYYKIEAACGCNKGKIRQRNEDNLYFAEKSLEMKNSGLKQIIYLEEKLKDKQIFAIFDGMGGEEYGDIASFIAAKTFKGTIDSELDFHISPRDFYKRVCMKMNNDVYCEASRLMTERMGTTIVSLYFERKNIYVCNLGDSKAFRIRNGEFLQLTKDHIEKNFINQKCKPGLTQYLGIDPNEMTIEPYIAKGELQKGDWYLLCSDGLTDMLSNFEISDYILKNQNVEEAVNILMQESLNKGGKDNITVMACKIVGEVGVENGK